MTAYTIRLKNTSPVFDQETCDFLPGESKLTSSWEQNFQLDAVPLKPHDSNSFSLVLQGGAPAAFSTALTEGLSIC